MDLAEIIRSESEAAIRHECSPAGRIKKPALIPFFLNHEHLKVLRKNLKLEIFGAEMKYGAKMDKTRVIKLVKAGVDVFLHAALEAAKLAHISPAERRRQETENGREQSAAEWYAEEQKALRSTAISGSTYIPDAKKEAPASEAEAGGAAQED